MSKNVIVAGDPPVRYDPQIDRLPDRVLRLELLMDNLATKKDLADVEGRLDSKIESTRADFNKAFGELDAKVERRFGQMATKIEANKTEIEKVRADVEKVRTDVEKVRTDVEKVRTDLEKGHKENRTWLLKSTLAIIGTVVAVGGYLGNKVPQTIYAPQESPPSSVNALPELEELRNLLLEIKQAREDEAPSPTN